LFVGAAGYFGWFTQLFEWLPRAAMFPILVYVGLEITAQTFRATPPRHYPALALAALPALAALAAIPLNQALGGREPASIDAGVVVLTLRCLANGFIVTSLLWAAALAALLDRQLGRSALYLLVAAVFALFGIIHSPLASAPVKWPSEVLALLPPDPRFRCQSPYHWAAGYLLCAAFLLTLGLIHPKTAKETAEKGSDPVSSRTL
jgi:AGZA family xanthine/uracil permease-like MFS transporter